jgi:hypothetical protein
MGHKNNSGETHADLNRMILEIVLRDFESFESIVAKLSKSKPEVGSDEVKGLLLGLLADDLLGTYLIHADPPYFTPVDATLETIERYWLLITEEGKRHLETSAKPQASVLQEEQIVGDSGAASL